MEYVIRANDILSYIKNGVCFNCKTNISTVFDNRCEICEYNNLINELAPYWIPVELRKDNP